MRRRMTQEEINPQQNLDPFLDILMNVVGALMFIGLFVSLIAVLNTSEIKRFPLARETEKKAYWFEVRNQEIIDLKANMESMEKEARSFLSSLSSAQCYDWQCVERKFERVNNFSIRTSHYKYSLYPEWITDYIDDGFRIKAEILEPLPNVSGESSEEFISDNSQFQQTLKKLNPDKDFLFFLVRPDSFETFEEIWNLVEEKKFDVGWNPFDNNEQPIIFGSEGRGLTCLTGC